MISLVSFQLRCVAVSLLLVLCGCFPQEEVRVLQTFKDGIYEDPQSFLANWNPLDSNPCDWNGVICSFARDHVVKINITGASLKGFIAPELSHIIYLQELRLHGNFLVGTIPREIATLKYIRVLDLGSNQLSGSIPSELGNLTSLQKINLASNGLTGDLPPEIGKLKNLVELRIDKNKLHGYIPAGFSSTTTTNSNSRASSNGLCHASRLKIVDFSFNFFNGSIPTCLKSLPSAYFQGNCFEVQYPKQRSTAQCSPSKATTQRDKPSHQLSSKRHASRPKWLAVVEIVTVSLVSAVLFVAFVTLLRGCSHSSSIVGPWRRLSNKMAPTAVCVDSETLKGIERFSRQELEVACEDFSNIIGSWRGGHIYKGITKSGAEIAVVSICAKEENWGGAEEAQFQREVADMARLKHENIGKLVGYCEETAPFSRMLVFEYASNGTLYEHLHYGEACQFSWARRMRIAVGIARGLRYIHCGVEPPFAVTELSSGAVYFTEEFLPKVIDLERWKGEGAGDRAGNVYAFGVILLELVSGRAPWSERGCIVDWAREYIEVPEAMAHVVDPELGSMFKYEELQAVCEAVALCIEPDASRRPSMAEVCRMLETTVDPSLHNNTHSSLAWATDLAFS